MSDVCAHCHEPIVPGATCFREVVHCWVKVRAKGANAPYLARYSGRVVHETCLLPAERGVQLTLELENGV